MTGVTADMKNFPFPNVWGPGAMFALSGYDEPTDFTAPFVGRLMEEATGIDVYCESGDPAWALVPSLRFRVTSARLTLAGYDRDRSVVAGDWILLAQGGAELEFICFAPGTFYLRTRNLPDAGLKWETVQPRMRCGVGFAGTILDEPEGTLQLSCEDSELVLVLRYPQQGPLDVERITADVLAGIAARRQRILAFYAGIAVPGGLDAQQARVYAKAASILKLNVESAQGKTTTRWTTPDKFPHRHMWLWDSAFHAIGWRYLDPAMALEALYAVLERTGADGFIPISMNPLSERMIGETQPPILGWALARVADLGAMPREDLAWFYNRLVRFLDWILEHRAMTGSGLLGWYKDESSTVCRCGESGWDNATRFDHPGPDDNIDLCSFVVRELDILAETATHLGRRSEAARHAAKRDELAALINDTMWCEEDGLYYDVDGRGEFVRYKTAACFFPLAASIPDPERAERLAAHLMNEKSFLTRIPIPTMAPTEPCYEKDMWRGPAWLNCSYTVIEGLKRYGLFRQAAVLETRIIEEVARWYDRTGCIMEYYDCEGLEDPRTMLRKGSRTEGIRVIRDLGWSAAVFIALSHERGLRS